jgi:flagellar biogenesis protein FliO
MSAILILFTAVLCALPASAGAEPRLTSPVTYAAPAPEATSTPAAPAAKAPSGVAGPSAPSAGAQATPLVAPAPPLAEAPAALRAPERSGAGVPGARGQALEVGWAATRLALACAAVGVLLLGGLKLYRRSLQPGPRAARRRSGGWLARWVPGSADDEDRITLLARSYLGTRESVCVLRVGTERFLVGVTSAQISMLGRLGGGAAETVPVAHEGRRGVAADGPAHLLDSLGSPAAAPRTATPDFSEALMAAALARDGGGDAGLRQALARSRARLAEIVSGRSPGA